MRVLHWIGRLVRRAALLVPMAVAEASPGAQGVAADGAGAPIVAPKTARRRPARPGRRRPAPPPSPRHTEPIGEIALAADLQALLGARTARGEWGVLVASLSRGDTLFSFRGDTPMLPASTMKLYTTALAFDRLGPAFQIATDVLHDGTIDADGTLHGSLYLKGGGDPSLSRRYVPGAPDAPMRTIARLVAESGIRRVTGDVVGDASAFEPKRIPDGWLARYLGDSYAARVSALSLNENLLHVAVAPGRGGGTGMVTLQPATAAYRVVNQVRTGTGGRGARVRVQLQADGTLLARGSIGRRAGTQVYSVVVDDPARFTTGAFREALAREGIAVDGGIRLATTPATAARIGSSYSPPLWTLATDMNGESINHIAELLLRTAARVGAPDGVGSAERGNALLRDLLARKAGVDPAAIDVRDGSGLSSLNRVTARSEVQLLDFAHRAPWSREFHESLPVAGRSETLRRRMIATPAMGNLHAKTGTTADVVALSGYVSARNGELLGFAFLYNGRQRWQAKETIDAMGATLAAFTR